MGSAGEPVTTVPRITAPPTGALPGLAPAPTTPPQATAPLRLPALPLTDASPQPPPSSSPTAFAGRPADTARHSPLARPVTTGSSPAPLSPKVLAAMSPRSSPRQLTGTATRHSRLTTAVTTSNGADGGREQSPNPAVHVRDTLLGHGQGGFSRLQDAPKTLTTASSARDGPANPERSTAVTDNAGPPPPSSLPAPPPQQYEPGAPQASPMSTSSIASIGSAPPSSSINTGAVSSTVATGAVLAAAIIADRHERRSENRQLHDHHILTAPPGERSHSSQSVDDRRTNRALTFPGPLLSNHSGVEVGREPLRGMSLPMPDAGVPGQRLSPTTTKKHKCPYCDTDFTRHHNLKSHLLTHSHEKPFVCSTCQARFRRLHDLKRHAKLHTGERPHICRRCGRRFARGDALARHNKGQGGCAGRRTSVGSQPGDDESMADAEGAPDEAMEGLLYSGDSHDDDAMDEDGPSSSSGANTGRPAVMSAPAPGSGSSLVDVARPSHTSAWPGGFQMHPHSSTYPPAARREIGGPHGSRRLQPPSSLGAAAAGSSAADNAADSAFPFARPSAAAGSGGSSGGGGGGGGSSGGSTSIPGSAGGMASILSHGGITESPAPLSPANIATGTVRRADSSGARRPRSPSLTQQLQQRQLGRRGSARSPPRGGSSLPPPLPAGGSGGAGGGGPSLAPSLPSLSGLAAAESAYGMPPRAPVSDQQQQQQSSSSSALLPQLVSTGSALSSALSSSRTGGGGGGGMASDSSAAGDAHMGYGRGEGDASRNHQPPPPSTEAIWGYVRSLESRVNQLTDEVTGLRRRLSTTNSAPHTHSQGGDEGDQRLLQCGRRKCV